MVDDKTEELKLALKKTFGQENNTKQDFIKQNKANSGIQRIANDNKKTINNLLMYILIFINFILICIIFYVLVEQNKTNIAPTAKSKNVIQNQENINENQNKKTIEKVKAKYMQEIVFMNEEMNKLKETHKKQINFMNKKIQTLGSSKIQNITTVSNLDVRKLFLSEKFKLLKCYKSKKGSNFLSKSCKDNIKIFINKYKKLARFEIIGVIAQDDDVLYEKLNTNDFKNLPKDVKKTVKEYLFKGLARERVLEAFWHIKEVLKSDIIIIPTNYYVTSIKESKGIVIKAYY